MTNYLYKLVSKEDAENFVFLLTQKDIDNYLEEYSRVQDREQLIETLDNEGITYFIIYPEDYEEIEQNDNY